MIHPDHFGKQTYSDMLDALQEHGSIDAKKLSIGLNAFGRHIKVLFFKRQNHAIREYQSSKLFEMRLEGLEKALERVTQEMYFEGAAQGFQVEDQNHRIHEKTEHELLEWREAKNLVDSLNQSSDTRWYILPIGKEREWQVKKLGHTQTLIESLQFARDRNLNTCTRAELISLAQTGMIVADKAELLAEELASEKKQNLRAARLREKGEEVMTISREEYETLVNHTVVLKAMIADQRFKEDVRHILSEIKEDYDLNEKNFDELFLMTGEE